MGNFNQCSRLKILKKICASTFQHDFSIFNMKSLLFVRPKLNLCLRFPKRWLSVLSQCKDLPTIQPPPAIKLPSASDFTKVLQNFISKHYLSDAVLRFASQDDEKNKNKSEEEKEKKRKDKENTDLAYLLLLTIGIAMIFHSSMEIFEYRTIKWEDFVDCVLSVGEVKSLTIIESNRTAALEIHPGGEQVVRRALNIGNDRKLCLKYKNLEEFEKNIRAAEDRLNIPAKERIEIIYKKSTTTEQVVTGIYDLLINIIIFVLIMMMLNSKGSPGIKGMMQQMDPSSQMNKVRSSLKGKDSAAMRAATGGVTFKDVAGLKAAKQEVAEFVDYLKHPDKFSRLGARLPRGALLLGPPGCGKTLLVKALANEADVPFFYMGGPEFVEVIGGVGASRVRKLFENARKQAPSIIFIDEIDTIGGRRSGTASATGGAAETEQTLNQLLVEMDGMDTAANIIVFAATNRHEVLDKALLRAGRFDRHVLIDLPTLDERNELFDLYLKKYLIKLDVGSLASRLAAMTPGMSGADIANMCNEAALTAAREKHASVLLEDFDVALERVIAGAAKKSSTQTPGERRVVAVHECGHAITGWMQKTTDALMRISILPRTSSVGGFVQTTPAEKMLYSKDDLFEKMVVLLGGRAAELVVNDRANVTTGAHDDLKKVTNLAYTIVRNLGMSDVIGQVSYSETNADDPVQPYSNLTKNLIDEEANRLIGKAYLRAQEIINANQDKLHLLTAELLKKETLTYEQVVEVIGVPPHGHKRTVDPLLMTDDIRIKTD